MHSTYLKNKKINLLFNPLSSDAFWVIVRMRMIIQLFQENQMGLQPN